MGERGPRPANIRELHFWEFEWFRAFRLLRFGQELPRSRPKVGAKRLEERIRSAKAISPEEIAAHYREGTSDVARLFAEWDRDRLVDQLESLRPRTTKDKERRAFLMKSRERRDIWTKLWEAKSVEAVRVQCRRWRELPITNVRFVDDVCENAGQFIRMTKNKRFPSGPHSDRARIVYLSRGMAGVVTGRSPMTAIDLLRKIKHEPGGPFWYEPYKQCMCFQCIGRREDEGALTAWNELLGLGGRQESKVPRKNRRKS
jgi:hypothetical protein